ncbi:alpha/beta hydrolase [Candidatus Laterigemmans baculatus]|uniref:alpha/beta hydrolase n=2 Tax=Candidatus Laterigemmans baculatus TaxID=2770505 RepID=UPI0028F40AF9|nr:alpha/beta hydrolase [Candidatus Laterigemmans baculatus]
MATLLLCHLAFMAGCSSERPDVATAPPETAESTAASGRETAAPIEAQAPRIDAGAHAASAYPAPAPEHPAANYPAPESAAAAEAMAPMAMRSAAPMSHQLQGSNQLQGPEHLHELPAGSTHAAEEGYATVQVFYATDRARDPLSLEAYQISGARQPVMLLGVLAVGCGFLALLSMLRGRSSASAVAALGAVGSGGMAAACVVLGSANIEKHGVIYNSERGTLTRGVCEVTVPDSHQRGQVERPSLLRFEFREDQRKHVVLTSAVELTQNDFQRRLAELVDESDERDLLVFIHGYNVDFESAVQRTAQIAVDLPFHGVPICYSWPSQGTLLGYPVDENNVAWTTSHLRSFLMELAESSGADSINLVAHSMGNRALTSALSEISFQLSEDEQPPFDRVVLAAPDVDADHFRKDLAPRLLETSRHVTLYASSDDRALIASKQVHGYPRAGESGSQIVVVPGVETIDVSGIDLSLLGHSYYGDNGAMLRDLFQLVHDRLPAGQRASLLPRGYGTMTYWQLAAASLAERVAPPVR